mgnify:CR=1 FL=1
MSRLGSVGHAEVISVLLGNAKGCEDVLLSREDLTEIDGISIWPPMTK